MCVYTYIYSIRHGKATVLTIEMTHFVAWYRIGLTHLECLWVGTCQNPGTVAG